MERERLAEAAAWRVATRTVLFIFSIVAVIWLAVQLRSVVVQVLLAVIIAAGMAPIVDRLTQPLAIPGRRRRWTPPQALIVLLLYLAALAAVVLLGALVLPPAATDLEELVRGLPGYVGAVQDWLTTLPERFPFLAIVDLGPGVARQLAAGISDVGALLGQAVVVVQVALNVLSGALNGIFVLVLALYITADRDRIRRYLVGFLPADHRERAERTLDHVGIRLGGWLRGQLLLSAIIGGMTLVGLLAIGVRYAVLLSLVAAVGEAVPLIGPIISAVPAVIVAFFQSPLQGLLTLGLYVVIQQLENNLVVPKVMQQAVALHPLAVMVALLAGGELMGVTGAVLSVPVTAAIAVVIDAWRTERP